MSLITGKNIVKTFQTDEVTTEVLKGINLSIFAGEFVAIMGRSGAGKSTLLYLLSALDRPTSGEIIIDEKNILNLSNNKLSTFRLYTLGYIFQDYALIPDLTTEENVILPLLMRGLNWRIAKETAQKALDAVNLSNKYNNLPNQLSGGEQQRVSIARAVAGKPKIIFADEPTANLDSVSGQTVIDLLAKLNRDGQTIVMVTHEKEYTKDCDRIIYLEDGQIIDERNLSENTLVEQNNFNLNKSEIRVKRSEPFFQPNQI